jgi:glucan 1,3-beta-glucosidase
VPETVQWLPVGCIALSGGLFLGWALAQAPLESFTAIDWSRSIFLLSIGFLVPPICAAAIARRTPMAGFATVLDPMFWRAAVPLERLLAAALMLTVMAGMALALGLVFDPRYRDFHFAPLTGPAVALAIASEVSPAGLKRRGVAEWIAGSVLAASAIYISFNETPANWQGQWFAALLLLLAASCWRLQAAQN